MSSVLPATSKQKTTLAPLLSVRRGAAAIEFYKKAFGAVEEMRMLGPDGKLMHAALRIGDSMVMLAEENPDWGSLGPKALKGSSVTIHMMVGDADAAMAKAADAGATVTMPAADQFWGDRYGQFLDPFGHRWAIAHRIRDLSPQEMQEAMQKLFAESPS